MHRTCPSYFYHHYGFFGLITTGVLSEIRVPGQPLPVYRRNEQLQTGPVVGGEQDGMELEEGGNSEHEVSGFLGEWALHLLWGHQFG